MFKISDIANKKDSKQRRRMLKNNKFGAAYSFLLYLCRSELSHNCNLIINNKPFYKLKNIIMKRKTILSCFAALLGVFLATGAFAQPWANTAPWHGTVSPYGTVPFQPAANNAPGLEQIGYAGSDTLFICLPHTANINLGVDVLSAYLPNTHGKWTWVYPVIVPIDTSNVFPTTGLTPGQTYIFKYTVTQTSCDLKIGDWLYAFVVVVPDLRNVSKDTTVCVGTGNLTIPGTQVTNSFSANLKQFIADWSVAATPDSGVPNGLFSSQFQRFIAFLSLTIAPQQQSVLAPFFSSP